MPSFNPSTQRFTYNPPNQPSWSDVADWNIRVLYVWPDGIAQVEREMPLGTRVMTLWVWDLSPITE